MKKYQNTTNDCFGAIENLEMKIKWCEDRIEQLEDVVKNMIPDGKNKLKKSQIWIETEDIKTYYPQVHVEKATVHAPIYDTHTYKK